VVWTKETKEGFPMVAAGKNTVFVVEGDIVGLYKGDDKKRRAGIPVAKTKVKLSAFDVSKGTQKWTTTTTRVPSWIAYSDDYGMLVTTNRSGIDARYGSSGELKWSKNAVGQGFKGHPENYYGRVILRKNQVIDQRGPGTAYNIETGGSIQHTDPITGKEIAWEFTKEGHHCNYAIASEHLLTFRAADAGFCDLESGGTGRLVGFRSGCRNSLIPANGVLNAPNMAYGCVCGYSIFTSLALYHVPESNLWTYGAIPKSSGAIDRIGINFGAPGDRRADNGTMWLNYPNVGGPSPKIAVKVATDKPETFQRHPAQIKGEGLRWVAASGLKGATSVNVPLVIGAAKTKTSERRFTVRLYFVSDTDPSDSAFDIALQGKSVLEGFDISKEAGEAGKMIVREFRGVLADRELLVEFTPKKGKASICGVEVVAE
jgi:hypothetical protein